MNYISNSQVSIYNSCPLHYKLRYIDKLSKSSGNIFTVFGTAFHETLQLYLDTLFNKSVKLANSLNLPEELQIFMKKEYLKAKEKNGGEDICSLDDIKEFYLDGLEILNYFKKKRNKYFSTREWELLEIEQELLTPVTDKINFKGYLDIVLKNKKTNKIKIIDIKTSYGGWKDKKKKALNTRMQLIFYKNYYAQQFNIPLDDIEVEYFIVKRKIYDSNDWVIPRIQLFVPPSSRRTTDKYLKLITEMVENVFDKNGNRIDKKYPANKSTESCKWCEFKKTKHCPA